MFRSRFLRRLSSWIVVAVSAFVALVAPTAADPGEMSLLRIAWIAADIGQVTAAPPHQPADLQIVAAAAERASLGVSFVPMGRAAALTALAEGEVDAVLPSTDDTPRVSLPYGFKRDILLCARGLPVLDQRGLAALEAAYERGWRIAVLRDAPYGTEIEALASAHADQTQHFGDAGSAIAAIVEGGVQCILAPRLAILAALAAAPAREGAFVRNPLDIGTVELRLRYGATVSAETIAALDAALALLRDDGSAEAIEVKATRPIMFRFAVAAPWFFWFDVIGTIAFALSGALIARAEGFSLLGAFVLAALPAVGGGVVRDLLVGRDPIGILADPLPLFLVVGTVLAATVAGSAARQLAALRAARPRRLPRAVSPGTALEVTDAIGLATFTVIGVSVAVQTGAEPLWLWGPFLAALSGAGGGILRDLLRSGYENPALRTSFYAEVCVIWGFALSVAILVLLPDDKPALLRLMVVVAVAGALATRLLVVALRIRSPRF